MAEFQVEPHSFEAASHYHMAPHSDHPEDRETTSAHMNCGKFNTNDTGTCGLKHVGEWIL